MNLIKTHSEYSWSLLDPRPVLRYVESVDDYIVYWNGIVMPHLVALNIAMEFFGTYPTPTMKARLLSNYKRIYYANGFGEMNPSWETIIKDGRVYNYLKNQMIPHAKKLIETKTHSEVLGWFNYRKARTDVSINEDA